MAMRAAIAVLGLAAMSACGGADINDSRAQALVRLPGPQHYAVREMARELTARCSSYVYDQQLAERMSRERGKLGLPNSLQVRSATVLEADLQRRSVAARYGADWQTLDACEVLTSESVAGTTLSVLVKRRG